MATNSVFVLQLICLLGIVCGKGIKIETTYETRKSDGQNVMYSLVNLNFGNSDEESPSAFKSLAKPSFICAKPKSKAQLFFPGASMTKMEIILYAAKNSDSYDFYQGSVADVDWSFDQSNLCLVFGTYHPKSSNTLHLYLNFISNVHSLSDQSVVFLKSAYSKNLISSTLMITKQKISNKELIKEVYPTIPTNLAVGKQAGLEVINQSNETLKLVIGYVSCEVDRNQIEFNLDNKKIAQTAEGELNIAFATKPISYDDALTYGMKYIINGINSDFDKKWAKVACSETGIQFTTLIKEQNRRVLSGEATHRNIFI